MFARTPSSRSCFLLLLAQLEALNLSCRGLRQVDDEFDPARVFIWREPAFHMLLQSCRKLRRVLEVRAKNDIRLGFNQAVFIGLPHHGSFEHSGVRRERRLDLEWRYPDTANFEHVIVSSGVNKVSVFTLGIFVAAARPGAEKSVAAFVTVVPLVSGDGRPRNMQLANLAHCGRFTFVV